MEKFKVIKKHDKQILKQGRKIIGFVFKNVKDEFWYSFGNPSNSSSMAFSCKSFDDGISTIKRYMFHA